MFCVLNFHANGKDVIRKVVRGWSKRIVINLPERVMVNIIIMIINDL